jgi:hypothetical protein
MSTRSNGLTYRRSARIPPPTFLPTAGNTNVPNNPPFDRHSTYSEILQAYSATDLSNSDSVQEYDDWIKSHREKNQNKMYLDEKVEVGPSTAQLIKGYSRKAKKVAKVDKFKAFQEGLDGTSSLVLTVKLKLMNRTSTAMASTSYTSGG